MTPLDSLNTQPTPEARQTLLTCCGSGGWAEAVLAHRPFANPEALLATASERWFALEEPDWLEAFAHHPRIGEVKVPTTNFLTHSTAEQSTTQRTLASEIASKLIEGNQAYEAKFGFLYIVFASGRTAPELLEVLHQRLANTRAEELHEAARQQSRITQLRLKRYLQS